MRRALIGHTGFIGGTLLAAGGFTHTYNSQNFHSLAGERFDEIVCAGISAVKWLANKDPEADWAGIQRLLDVLAQVQAGRLLLISTIDVYPDAARALDEDAALADVPNEAYGRHRQAVEQWVIDRFPVCSIVRLPALFGEGLKKNALYDLLNDNQIEKINPASAFQWYPTARLSGDLARIADAGLPIVNLFTEPLTTRDIVDRFFPGASVGSEAGPVVRYALRTKHAALFGGAAPYVMSGNQVLTAMSDFVNRERQQ
jgi:NAD-dependent epimerase/dehydratase family protein